jgi:hypothetical protein
MFASYCIVEEYFIGNCHMVVVVINIRICLFVGVCCRPYNSRSVTGQYLSSIVSVRLGYPARLICAYGYHFPSVTVHVSHRTTCGTTPRHIGPRGENGSVLHHRLVSKMIY